MKILLFFPPQWDIESVYPSLPALTSVLRRHGHHVIQRDLNIELNDFMLSKAYFLHMAPLIQREIENIEKGTARSKEDSRKLHALRVACVLLEMVFDDVEVAKAELRNPDLGIDRSVRNQAVLQIARKIISAPFYPSEIRLRSYITAYKTNSIPGILEGAHSVGENIYGPLFDKRVIPQVLEEAPDIIGISIVG